MGSWRQSKIPGGLEHLSHREGLGPDVWPGGKGTDENYCFLPISGLAAPGTPCVANIPPPDATVFNAASKRQMLGTYLQSRRGLEII